MTKQMDALAVFIATLHGALGHDKAAAYLGTSAGDKSCCILCLYDQAKASREDVIEVLGQ